MERKFLRHITVKINTNFKNSHHQIQKTCNDCFELKQRSTSSSGNKYARVQKNSSNVKNRGKWDDLTNLIISGVYPMMRKLMTSRPNGEEDGGNFEFSNWKMGLVTCHLKGRFKTMILIEVVSPCDDY